MVVDSYGVPALREHIPPIAAAMRRADREEVWALGHYTPEAALNSSLEYATRSWTMMIEGKPVAMLGVSGSVLGKVGAPWLLATDALGSRQWRFLRESRDYVDKMLEVYPELANCVHAKHQVAVKWLKWLGFEFLPARPMGVENELFYPFFMRRK